MPARAQLPGDQVDLWQGEVDPSAPQDAQWTAWLSAAEVDRAERFHAPLDGQRYRARRAWLRLLLAGYLGATPAELIFAADDGGKPRLCNPGAEWLCYSLSHSASLVVVAVARRRDVGVDVEQVRDEIDVEAIARRFFSLREQETLATLPSEQRLRAFFSYWTMKEAYVKATGAGLRDALPEFDAPLEPGQAATVQRIAVDTPEHAWRVQAFDVGGAFRAAVAIKGEDALVPRAAREFLTE